MALASTAAVSADRHSPAPARALEHLLDDLAALLVELPVNLYTARPARGVSGSIGEHVRHALDHVGAFVMAGRSAVLTYDRRERGTAVEFDPSAALRQIFRLKAALAHQAARDLDEPVEVASMIAASGESVTGWSTRSRELAFVVSHTIHHQAIIALLLAFEGLAVPGRFGYAPSTPQA
jgi:uncharacterized damage-inducible protein DinB